MNVKSNLEKLIVMAVFACFVVGAGPLRYKGKPFLTYPMPPKATADDPLRITPAMQIPEDPDRIIWKLVSPKFSKGIKEVPVFERLKPTKVGSLPLGTTVKLEKFMGHGKTNFYAVPWQNTTAWINGVFVSPAGFASPAQ
jgi:hypothetical protein